MAYAKTNWVNDTTSINADHLNNIENGIETLDNEIGALNDLETQNTNTIVNALNGLATGEIVGSNLSASAGYIKYSNGFMIQWQTKSITTNVDSWGNTYYYDTNMNNWAVPFVLLFGSWVNSGHPQFWCTGASPTTTNAGLIRVCRPNSANYSMSIQIVAIGTWK